MPRPRSLATSSSVSALIVIRAKVEARFTRGYGFAGYGRNDDFPSHRRSSASALIASKGISLRVPRSGTTAFAEDFEASVR
jgi:hypothetical protein